MSGPGRPSLYTDEIATEILRRVADGESVREICKTEGMPAPSTVRGWVVDDLHGFSERSARAHAVGRESLAEECLDIADNAANDYMGRNDPDNPGWQFNGDHVQRSKLRIDTRLRLLGKWDPKKWGDKLDLKVDAKVQGSVSYQANIPTRG